MRGGEKGRSEPLDELGALPQRVIHLEAVAGQDETEETTAISTFEDEKWLRILSRVSPIGIFRTDLQGHCLYVNARWSEITGLTAEEAYGQGWGRTLHHEDQERVFSAWTWASQNRTPFREEYRFQRASGEITWVLGQAEAERGEDGAVVGYVGTITDITEKKILHRPSKRPNRTLSSKFKNGRELLSKVTKRSARARAAISPLRRPPPSEFFRTTLTASVRMSINVG